MLKQTILNEIHRASLARMVDFGGWDMPVNYGSQIEEHHIVRKHAGLFDVSHMCPVDLKGSQVREFLSRLLANDVAKLKTPGKALYSCMLKPEGGVIDDLIVYYLSEQHFRLVINAGTAIKDLAWMQTQLNSWQLDVSIAERRDSPENNPLAIIAIQGPKARKIFWAAYPETQQATEGIPAFFAVQTDTFFIARTGYTGEDGFEVMMPLDQANSVWQQLVAHGAKPCGLGARDTLRLEAGMNLYGQDMDETISPLDAGLAWTVSSNTERDFVGKTALLSQGQQKQFLGLRLLDKGVLRSHQKVITKQGDGEITSGTFSPTLEQSIALARLPLGTQIGDLVDVDIRGKMLKAEVAKPVFARHGQSLI
ncbi:MAG: glycine cleavage system aminomethyltransferase GcvT [Pseudomonadota bacterium]|jgi:aminomethyltransferase